MPPTHERDDGSIPLSPPDLPPRRESADEAGELEAARLWRALFGICDPEIPPLSIVEMGMIAAVDISASRTVRIRWLPTFAGCPALGVIGAQIEAAARGLGYSDVRVETVFDPPWTSDRISDEGRRKLREFGLTPPARLNGAFVSVEMLEKAACPVCGSKDTTLESPFGPTLCRAIHYCRSCRNSFEQFKPV